jgi:CHAD domain-containing protein
MTDAARSEQPLTAEDVIRSIIRTAADGLLASESDAIADAPDGVHQHRTHVRRLRSVLAGFRTYLDDSAAKELRVQFGEWGGQLGVVRDIEVRAEVALEAMDDLGIDDPQLRARLVDDEYEDYTRAHARLRELHEGPRADARTAALQAFADDPPLTSAADADAEALMKVARREARRVKKAAKRSDGSIESLHDVRKAGRRLRYVAEALHEAAPEVFNHTMEELAAAGEEVHDALGDHRDELIFIERLEIARARAGRADERVDPYDTLIDRSKGRAKHALHGLADALDRVGKAASHL